MSDKPIEIEFDNKEVHEKLLNLAKRTENLRPLMKNIAGIFAYSTEENFKETIDTLNKIKFTKVHTFPYSKRSGTKAASMPNQVDGNIKKCRVKEVIALSDKYELAFYKQKIGNTYNGIIETRKDGKKIVITSNYIPIEVETNKENNCIVNVKLLTVNNNEIKGEII